MRRVAYGLLLTSGVAHADALVWSAPAGCPDEAAFVAAVRSRLETPSTPLAGTVTIEVRDGGFAATLTLGGEPRELVATRCDELVAAAAVIFASAVPEPPPPPVVRRELVVPPPPQDHPRWHAAVGVAVLGGQSAAPDFDLGGELAVRAAYRSYEVSLSAARWLEADRDGIEIRPTAFALRVGRDLANVRLWAAGELDRVTGTRAMAGAANAYLLGAGAGYAYPLATHVTALGTIELGAALHRVRFAAGDEILYETPRVTARAGIGVEISWF